MLPHCLGSLTITFLFCDKLISDVLFDYSFFGPIMCHKIAGDNISLQFGFWNHFVYIILLPGLCKGGRRNAVGI